jgi:hypothetical protein
MFVNAMGLENHIALMVDDDPNKAGCFVPGTATKIVPSAVLLEDRSVSACILAVHPRVQSRVHEKLRPLLDRGVMVRGLFAGPGNQTLLDEGR